MPDPASTRPVTPARKLTQATARASLCGLRRDVVVLAVVGLCGFCLGKGYDRAASYEGRLVVESSGYARFAKIRCEKIVAEAAAPDMVAVR